MPYNHWTSSPCSCNVVRRSPRCVQHEADPQPLSLTRRYTIRKNVLILVQTASDWGRHVVAGIASYRSDHSDWFVHIEPRGLYEKLAVPRHWNGQGIIARLDHPALIEQVRSLDVPTVNVSWSQSDSKGLPRVTADERLAGEVAAEHFLDNGFTHFGYVGPIDRPDYHTDHLAASYLHRIEEKGLRGGVYEAPPSDSEMGWHDRVDHLTRWLRGLVKPVALLTWSDSRAREIVQSCWRGGMRVPDDVALVSAEHEPTMSIFAGVELSSVNLAPRKIGWLAAETLDRLMRGEAVTPLHRRVPPGGVTIRRSSDVSAVDDPLVAEAVSFMRQHCHEAITVDDLARCFKLSRRTLEKHFRNSLGRSPGEELRRLRLEQAKRMLRDTDLTLEQIAERSGYLHTNTLTRNLREQIGLTPRAFRELG